MQGSIARGTEDPAAFVWDYKTLSFSVSEIVVVINFVVLDSFKLINLDHILSYINVDLSIIDNSLLFTFFLDGRSLEVLGDDGVLWTLG